MPFRPPPLRDTVPFFHGGRSLTVRPDSSVPATVQSGEPAARFFLGNSLWQNQHLY